MFGRFGVAAQFVALALVWGSSFFFIKVGLTGLSPGQVAWARLVFGALALAVIVLARRRPLPRELVVWGHLAVVGVLMCVLPFLLFSWAEQHISSGLASIFNATTPLLTMLISAVALKAEKITRAGATGLVLGFAGVLVIVGVWHGISLGSNLTAQLACLGATTCYGLSFVYLRRFLARRGLDTPTLAFGQVGIGAVIMLALTPVLASSPVHASWPVVLSMLALGVLGTGVAYVWNTNIVTAWGASNAVTVTYLTPVVGVVLGVAILDEPLSWNQPVGAVLVIAGILAAHGRLTLRSRARAVAAAS
ncbi:DMT family transporter [Amycolatopsis sp.]|jgi:drug/metabolite transporter (DMT)-like permease|uniref:DMT family transporter n=1 Tax=Amycolatopsis sp. TaxID=37632 RepID=UPI002E08E169|nr:DMT family transporter [Amycolatopsis sp.]